MTEGDVPAFSNLAPSPSSGPSPSTSGARRRWVLLAAIAAVVAVLLVATLVASGVLRIGPGTASNPPYETFSEALATAQSGANSVAGGPWFAIAAVAVVTPTAVLEPATNVSSLISTANCTVSWPHGAPLNVAVPATGSTASEGAAAYWTFGLKNASDGLLFESVSDGVAATLLSARGGMCSEAAGFLSSFPAGLVDSPAAISAADAAGGTGFLRAHPAPIEVWGVYGGASLGFIGTSPEWLVEYTSCTLPTTVAESGAVFNATVGGTSGVVTAHTNGTANCVLTAPTGVSLPFHDWAPPAAARKAI